MFNITITVQDPSDSESDDAFQMAIQNAGMPLQVQMQVLTRRHPTLISEGLVEILLYGTGAMLVNHYAEKILNVIDAAVAKKITKIWVNIIRGSKQERLSLTRTEKEKDIKALKDALSKIEHSEEEDQIQPSA